MFDFTPPARVAGWLFVAFLGLIPVYAIVIAVIHQVTGETHGDHILFNVAPWLFAVVAVFLAVDFQRRLLNSSLTVTQVPGCRLASALTLAGCGFGLGNNNWVAPVVGLLAFATTCLPTRHRTIPSTWTPK